jgi:membrane protease YdiL (CAAX protease family)
MNSVHTDDFLELGRQGHSAWWRYVIGFTIIAVSYIIGNVVAFLNILWWSPTPVKLNSPNGLLNGVDPFLIFISANLVFPCILLAVWLVVRFLHGRPLMSLITSEKRIKLARIGWAGLVWTILLAITGVIGWFIFPKSIVYSLHLEEFLRFLPVVVLFVPIQCLTEELVFRGYLLQGLAPWLKSTWLLALVNGIAFGCMHIGAIEHADQALVVSSYVVVGVWLALYTISTNSIQCSLGVHIANNMFGFLVLGYEQFQFATSTVFVWRHTQPLFELASAVLGGLVLYLMIRKHVGAKAHLSSPS